MKDVIIIGAGPAGSTCASFLAKHGRSVTLLERETFPREHVGESLLPFCYQTFEALGVLTDMEALFVRKPTVRFISPDGSRSTNWCFNHVIKDPSALSFQVDRPVFDKLLLDNSRRLGVDVREGTLVTGVDLDSGPDRVAVSALRSDGRVEAHEGRFLIDASGRATFMATKNRWRVPNPGLERTALWSHFVNVKALSGGLEEGASVICYVGGAKRGWIWIFPLERDRITVGVVVDSAYLREQKRTLAASGDTWQNDLYQREIREAPFVRDLLEGAHMMLPVRTENDYSYNTTQKYGHRWALVGDAGRFIDPIFSSGIFLSMKSAGLVADALHDMFSSGDLADNRPLVRAFECIDGAYDFVFRLISVFYNPQAISWAGADAFFREHVEHEDAMAAGHYILSGDFFENHRRYHAFLDLLEHPHLFDAYRQWVIRRPAFNQPSCQLAPEEVASVFPPLNGTLRALREPTTVQPA